LKKDSTAAKRKHDDENEGKDGLRLKRAKVVVAKEPVVPSTEKSFKEPKRPKINDTREKPVKVTKGKGKGAKLDSDDEDNLEHNYQDSKSGQLPTLSGEGSSADEDGDDPTTLVHESLKKSAKKAKGPKAKHVPQTETPELRDQRTIFVGNLPIEVASKTVCTPNSIDCNAFNDTQPLKKSLQRHILSFLPTAKIESIRFRSIPFQTPTAKLPGSDDEGENPTSRTATRPKKGPRTHEKERASAWRSKLDEEDEESVQKDDKKYLNPAQKKKIAFINQEFHSTADTINAYIVFAHSPNVEGRSANLPPLPPTMDPYEAALSAAEACDGTLFMERMLRVDLVGKTKAGRASQTSDSAVKSSLETDPRLSIFVGNLDFASKEEDLRIFFEGIISAERGPPPVSREDSAERNEPNKPSTWVTRVRIVRDKDTQLGKGFAYVQFSVCYFFSYHQSEDNLLCQGSRMCG
jgi:nucleolar protein 12